MKLFSLYYHVTIIVLKLPFLETLKVQKMRFIAPWIATVAISGCSKNDKTTATKAATVGNLKKAPEAQKAVGTIGKNSEEKSIENGTDEGRLLKGDGDLQGSPDVVVVNGNPPVVVSEVVTTNRSNSPQSAGSGNVSNEEAVVSVNTVRMPGQGVEDVSTPQQASPQEVQVHIPPQIAQAGTKNVAEEAAVVPVSAVSVPGQGVEDVSTPQQASPEEVQVHIPVSQGIVDLSSISSSQQPVDTEVDKSEATPVVTDIVSEGNSSPPAVTEVFSNNPASSNSHIIPDPALLIMRAARIRKFGALINPPPQPVDTNDAKISVEILDDADVNEQPIPVDDDALNGSNHPPPASVDSSEPVAEVDAPAEIRPLTKDEIHALIRKGMKDRGGSSTEKNMTVKTNKRTANRAKVFKMKK